LKLIGKKNDPYCLVLSGGGAKGVYHIGAWKALKELEIEVNAFIGNSIGAIIAGFLAQGNEEQLYFIGDNITVEYLIRIPEEMVENGELKVNFTHLSAFRELYKDLIRRGGLDTSPLRKVLQDSLDEDLIRNSGNDLGVVTFNISDMKAKEVFLEQMEPGSVIDYLMASSAFPGFNHPIIKGKKYIDGGVYDNIPYKLARSRGYRKIIIIDISGMGINKRPNIEGTDTIYIKNSINMGGVLDFNRSFLNRYMELGYLDTMKTFGELKGIRYFISPDRKCEKIFSHVMREPETGSLLSRFITIEKETEWEVEHKLRSLLPHSMRNNRKDLLYSYLECCAEIFRLEIVHNYKVKELIHLLRLKKEAEDRKIEFLNNVHSRSDTRKLLKKINLIVKHTTPRNALKETPYHNIMLAKNILQGKYSGLVENGINTIYPELKGALFFLEILGRSSFPDVK
jgi:NTE family protein